LCIITSPRHLKATQIIKGLWESLGAKIAFIDASSHDKVLAYVSHIPHILSFSLAKLVPIKYHKFSSFSFADMTRVSISNPYLWRDIFLSNKENIAKIISEFITILKDFKKMIEKTQNKKLLSTLKRINQKMNG
jgi:prephenate dehydrogenase